MAVVVVIGLLAWITWPSGGVANRSETYKKVHGAAGLDAHITYDCKLPCAQKYDFNVYIFYDNGQQMNVLRPDKSGHIRLATAAGNYVMIIGKPIGKDGIFPQEKVTLKSGQQLDLTLQYKENAQ